MKPIYVRVSIDEQMRQGYSLIEQEERLRQYCEINNLNVTAIFREDYSAKDFNRLEWKQLIKTIKKNRNKPSGKIIFLKWDRFSRNIQFAYQMIGILKGLNIAPMAIDQPIDFDIPESIVICSCYKIQKKQIILISPTFPLDPYLPEKQRIRSKKNGTKIFEKIFAPLGVNCGADKL